MPPFTVTYNSRHAPEVVEADRVTVVESSGQIVFHKEVTVVNIPRDIVVRRLAGSEVRSVTEFEASRPPAQTAPPPTTSACCRRRP